ncbi:MAG: hypothetical protein R2800_08310 [Flavipsychrobacter sp.]
MRTACYISILLLLATHGYGQRYRLVADSTYEYDSNGTRMIESVTKISRYGYRECKISPHPKGQHLPFYDTAFHFIIQGDSLYLNDLYVYNYSKSGALLELHKYMQVELYAVDTMQDGTMNFGETYLYQNGSYVPVRKDTYTYSKTDKLIDVMFYESNAKGLDNSFTRPTKYDFRLIKKGKYDYFLGNRHVHKLYNCYFNEGCKIEEKYRYNLKGKLVKETDYYGGNITAITKWRYKKGKLSSIVTQYYDNYDAKRVKGYREDKEYSYVGDNEVATISRYYEKEYTPMRKLEQTYNESGQTLMFKISKYYEEGGYDIDYVGLWHYRYTSDNRLLELEESVSDDGVNFETVEKTTYTYEAY